MKLILLKCIFCLWQKKLSPIMVHVAGIHSLVLFVSYLALTHSKLISNITCSPTSVHIYMPSTPTPDLFFTFLFHYPRTPLAPYFSTFPLALSSFFSSVLHSSVFYLLTFSFAQVSISFHFFHFHLDIETPCWRPISYRLR